MNLSTAYRTVFWLARAPGQPTRGFRPLLVAIAMLFALGISAAPSPAQGVAETAKQLRAGKEEIRKKSKRVYTEEDLKRAQILTPEDRAQLEAARSPEVPTTEDPSVSAVSSDSQSSERSLGEVARIYRGKKELHTLERSAKFPLPPGGEPRLATPKPIQPNRAPPLAPIFPPTVKPAPSRPLPPAPVIRRSPFERPRTLYVAPRKVAPAPRLLTPPAVAPELRPLVPAQPKSASPRATPVPSAPVNLNVPIVPAGTPIGMAANSATPNPVEPRPTLPTIVVVAAPGDSLWKLAEHHLGRGQRWRELLFANPHFADPNHIRVGERIHVPASELRPISDSRYRVQAGDTLSAIAAAQLHRPAAWSCIAAANPGLSDPNRIRTGQILLVPASCAPWIHTFRILQRGR